MSQVSTAPASTTAGDSTEQPIKSAEALTILGVSRRTLQRWLNAGNVPGAFKVGRQWRFYRSLLVPSPRSFAQ